MRELSIDEVQEVNGGISTAGHVIVESALVIGTASLCIPVGTPLLVGIGGVGLAFAAGYGIGSGMMWAYSKYNKF